MKIIQNPYPSTWASLCERPEFERAALTSTVSDILEAVKSKGDEALLQYAERFDGVKLTSILVNEEEKEEAKTQVSASLKEAIQTAYDNIYAFHKAQQKEEESIETKPGIKCWRRSLPIEKVGLYIPGGSAPLFSTILMLGIPASIAGCKEMVLCTPPGKDGKVHPAILYTAQLVGITTICKVGGAQAVGAMAYGTQSVPQVYKIFGPGNQYVTKAKEIVQVNGTAIDMPAGPSEVLVIADETCQPSFVAADLLSQAEHGADSQVILLSTSMAVVEACIAEVNRQVDALPRKDIALKALANSKAIALDSIDKCFAWSNLYAPEHLIVASDQATDFIDKIESAGSVFLGNYSCESAGDYASGTNHTLPTNGYARNYSGVSLDSFVKKVTFQELSPSGLQAIGGAIEIMAEIEGLIAHKNAVSIRLKAMADA